MAAYIADKYSTINVNMITFGAPRVGNEAFKLFAEAKSNLSMWRYSYDMISLQEYLLKRHWDFITLVIQSKYGLKLKKYIHIGTTLAMKMEEGCMKVPHGIGIVSFSQQNFESNLFSVLVERKLILTSCIFYHQMQFPAQIIKLMFI